MVDHGKLNPWTANPWKRGPLYCLLRTVRDGDRTKNKEDTPWNLQTREENSVSNAVFGYPLCLVLSVQFMDICQFHFLSISTLNFDAKAIVHIILPISWNNHFDCHLLVKIFSVSLSATKIVLILQSAIQGLPQFNPTFLFDLIPPLPTCLCLFW